MLNVVENNTGCRIDENFVAPLEFVRFGHRFDHSLIISAGAYFGRIGQKRQQTMFPIVTV